MIAVVDAASSGVPFRASLMHLRQLPSPYNSPELASSSPCRAWISSDCVSCPRSVEEHLLILAAGSAPVRFLRTQYSTLLTPHRAPRVRQAGYHISHRRPSVCRIYILGTARNLVTGESHSVCDLPPLQQFRRKETRRQWRPAGSCWA